MKINRKLLVIPAAAVTFGALVAAIPVGPSAPAPRFTQATPMQAGTYTIDPAHTYVGFEIGHLGLSHVRGRFTKLEGKIVEDPKNLNASSVNFTAQVDSIDTAVAQRDGHLKTADFFDAAKYPTITFKSTRIRKSGNEYVADGDLTIKDVTKAVSIPFRHSGPINDPFGGVRVGIVAEPVKIDRMDYHVDWDQKLPSGAPQVDHEVTIHLSLEATQDKPANNG